MKSQINYNTMRTSFNFLIESLYFRILLALISVYFIYQAGISFGEVIYFFSRK